MAKRRRRRQPQPRPVPEDQGTATPAPSRASATRPVPQQESDVLTAMPGGPPPVIPNTGMPINIPGVGQLQNDDPRPEEVGYAGGGPIEQTGHWGPKEVSSSSSFGMGNEEENWSSQGIPGISGGTTGTGQKIKRSIGGSSSHDVQNWARGGSIPAPMPGYSDYTAMKTDPVARRRYSPRHVGFAGGGEVDPMDYVPDQPQEQRPLQQSSFDEFNVIGREDPKVNPMLADRIGYAKGGPIAAAQVPAYTDPVYPAPSAANAKLYSDMDAIRARTANPPALQMPAFNFSSASAPQGPVPQRGTVVIPPAGADDMPRLQRFAQGGTVPGAPDTGGYLNGDNAMDPQELDGVLQQIAQLDPSAGEDAVNLTAIVQAAQSGDMNRASSILAGFRRRFDSLNAHAQGAAAHGDMATAAQLAGKAHSQVPDGMTVNYAVAPDGNNVTATITPSGQTFQMNGQQFHDYLVGPGTSFDHILENGLAKNLAIASGGQGGQQAPGVNPAPTGYAEGGDVEKKGHSESEMREASQDDSWGRIKEQPFSLGRPGPGPTPLSPDNMRPRDTEPERRVFQPRGYQEGGEVDDDTRDYSAPSVAVQDDFRRQQEEEAARQRVQQQQAEQAQQQERPPAPQQQDDGSRQTVNDVLAHTRDQYGMSGQGGPSREDITSETAGLGLGGDRVAPLTGEETKEARNYVPFGRGIGSPGNEAGTIVPSGNATAGAGGVYYPPGYGPGGGGGGGQRRHRPSGGGGGGGGARRPSGGDRSDGGDTGTTEAVPQDVPYNYTTGYKQEPPTYTEQPPGTDLRRTDTEGRPIGPAMDQPVPEAATRGELTRTDTSGRPIGGVDTRPDPNDPREYARREFPNNPAGQNAVLANQYLKGSQREYNTLKQAGENRTLTADQADRLASLEKGRQEASYDWDAFAKENKLKSAQQIIQEAQQGGQRGGGGGRGDSTRRTATDEDGWPTGVPRGGHFANMPGTATRDYSEPVRFGRTGHVRSVGRAGSQPVYDVNGQTYLVDPRTGMPRAREFQQGYQGPRQGERGWTGTYPANQPAAAPPVYQTRPVAPTSQAPAPAAGPNATVGENAPPYQVAGAMQPPPTMAPRPIETAQQRGGPEDPENAAPYQVAGKDWVAPPAQPAAQAPAPAAGGAPAPVAPDTRGAPPGAVFNDRTGWQPAPNMRGFAGVPPPPSDQSPAAQAARMFPSAAQQAHRAAYQIQLERQEKEDALKREGYTSKETIQGAKNQAKWDQVVYQRDSIERLANGKQAIMDQHYKMMHDDNINALIIRHLDANSRMELQKYGDEIKAGVLTAETPRIRQLMDSIHKRAIEMELPIPELRPPPTDRSTTGTTTSTTPSVRTAPTSGAEGGTTAPDGTSKPGHTWTNQWGGGWIKQ